MPAQIIGRSAPCQRSEPLDPGETQGFRGQRSFKRRVRLLLGQKMRSHYHAPFSVLRKEVPVTTPPHRPTPPAAGSSTRADAAYGRALAAYGERAFDAARRCAWKRWLRIPVMLPRGRCWPASTSAAGDARIECELKQQILMKSGG